MGRVDGKVALISGAARGQGRAHAVRLAEEGADIIAFDICAAIPNVLYEAADEDDLAETARLVESLDRRVLTRVGDVRDPEDVDRVVADGLEVFGHIDVVVANAGIAIVAPAWEIREEDWAAIIAINLTGAWRVAKTVMPKMIDAGNGGSIIFTTSGTAARGVGGMAAYASTKSGLEGLCRELAVEGGPHRIRVNILQPTAVNTVMMDNQAMWELFTPGQDSAPPEERRQGMLDIMSRSHILDVPWVEVEDLANAVLFLASDESKMVTGAPLRVDAGWAAH
jgi:SDR family mycofactocin-dependent oxidoreductase